MPDRVRGTPLVVRLLAMVTVPVLTLGFFGVRRVQHELDLADDAASLADTIELQQAVGAVYPLAQLDRIVLEGLARIDELGLPRDLVALMTGIDLEGRHLANIPLLDAALAQLGDDFGDTVLTDGSRLGERVDAFADHLDRIRSEVGSETAAPADVQTAFAPLDALLDEALVVVRGDRTARAELSESRIQLDALSLVVASAGDHARALVRNVVYQTDELRAEVNLSRTTHEAFLSAFATTLTPEQQSSFDSVLRSAAALPDTPPLIERGSGTALANAEFIAASADAALAHLTYLVQLQEYSAEFHQAQVDRAEQAATASRTTAQRTIIGLALIALLTTLFIGSALWAVIAPIRSLTRRAERISRGQLDHEPIPVTGPSDLRSLIRTSNDMVVTLDRVRAELTRLASGDPTAEADELPGAIGVTMRESMHRLEELTQRLRRSEETASAIVDEAADAIWTLDEGGIIRSANDAAGHMCGVEPVEQLGRPIEEYLSSTDGDVAIRAGDRSVSAVAVSSVVDVGGERITVVIAHDISERARFEEQLAYQASHDPLTGLPNRFSLLHHLEERCSATSDTAVVFVDLDGFKSVNDTEGHAVGDQVLTGVAERLSRCVGRTDFVGRLGGDEFVIVSGRDDHGDPTDFGRRIITEIERPIDVGRGHVFTISASIGISVATPNAGALDMIKQADNALYQAKRRGRGRVEFYDESMQDQIAHEADLELALRSAVRDGELVLHLQPIVDLHDDVARGAEALVRWNRPGQGLVPPGDFIPVAERSSLIIEVERWVLANVCRQLVDWQGRAVPSGFRVAVNISGRHLIDGDLIGDLRTILDDTGADASMLELELTETQLLEDAERATAILDELRSWGVTIAVDDFGTGYSSLTYLRHLPIDTVKIDRSFVASAGGNGYDSTVIDAVLTISRSLGLSVVAEGIETEDQLADLRDRGCDRAQGFLLARPMPVEDAARMLFGPQDVAAPSRNGDPLTVG